MTKKRFFHPDELSTIRANCDWRRLLDDLGVRADLKRCTEDEFWGYSPFHQNEKTASFHMKAPGIWYDWSSHATAPGRSKPGGGVIELVQAVHAARGQIMKLNEAAGWIVDQGYSRIGDVGTVASTCSSPASETDDIIKQNHPISTDLTPRLSEQGSHPAFVERSLSAETCRYLRCGYLKAKRGALAGRLVFQVGGIAENKKSRVILSHMGRAITPEQEAKGKWRFYRGFNPSLELYNLDNLILDTEAARQVSETGQVLLVEGAFDVAKCIEAGIRNVVASFGARLSERQAKKLCENPASCVLVFYDRDQAGQAATTEAIARLQNLGVQATAFDWRQHFKSVERSNVPIPETIQDPCDFSVAQLRWLRGQGMV